MRYLAFALLILPAPGTADVLIATRTLRANTVLTERDVELRTGQMTGAAAIMTDALGLETRVALYAGRPVMLANLAPPAIVTRNQLVRLIFTTGGLRITAEGRALGRGGIGDAIRIINLTSRATLTGIVQPDGTVQVEP